MAEAWASSKSPAADKLVLPQLAHQIFLTDGGLETAMIYHEGFDLPHFAVFDLLDSDDGRAALIHYYMTYGRIARDAGAGFILESPTWRASPDWGVKLGYSLDRLYDLNCAAISMLHYLKEELTAPKSPIVISGCVGPRGDGYNVEDSMTVDEAADYHSFQIQAFKASEADMVTAITMTNREEAQGIADAARHAGLPVALSFTVETDGLLPSGERLRDVVNAVSEATDDYVAYYMINCAHPSHFADILNVDESWCAKLRGIRANASKLSHAELDEATELDSGNPIKLAQEYRALRNILPNLTILGGCCGTDERHIQAIAKACRI